MIVHEDKCSHPFRIHPTYGRVFAPWGVFGAHYRIADEATYENLRKTFPRSIWLPFLFLFQIPNILKCVSCWFSRAIRYRGRSLHPVDHAVQPPCQADGSRSDRRGSAASFSLCASSFRATVAPKAALDGQCDLSLGSKPVRVYRASRRADPTGCLRVDFSSRRHRPDLQPPHRLPPIAGRPGNASTRAPLTI